MPNNVKTVLKMEGIAELPIFRNDETTGYTKQLDFNKIIFMPKPLDITCTFGEKDVAIETIIRKICEQDSPFDTKRVVATTMTDEEYQKEVNKLKEKGFTEHDIFVAGSLLVSNKIVYGYMDWYGWRINNWGTKWNAYYTGFNVGEDKDTIKFSTAWSFPDPVIVQLSKMYPGKEIEAWYADEDIGANTGHVKLFNGEFVVKECFENHSNDAYECFIKCRGKSKCLYRGVDGNWYKRECEDCNLCD